MTKRFVTLIFVIASVLSLASVFHPRLWFPVPPMENLSQQAHVVVARLLPDYANYERKSWQILPRSTTAEYSITLPRPDILLRITSPEYRGDFFHADMRSVGSPTIVHPLSVRDLGNGSYDVTCAPHIDEGIYTITVKLLYSDFQGYRAPLPIIDKGIPSLPPIVWQNDTRYPFVMCHDRIIARLNVSRKDPLPQTKLAPCRTLESPGRWIGDTWQPFACMLLPMLSLTPQCRKKGRLLLLGDSTTRGIFFDIWDAAEQMEHDRAWGKSANVLHCTFKAWNVTWVSWKLGSEIDFNAYAAQAFDVVVWNSGSWDAAGSDVTSYYVQLFTALHILKTLFASSRIIWRSVSAVRNAVGFQRSSYRYITLPRMYMFKEVSSALMRAYGVEVFDIWDLTSSRLELLAGNHFDKLYIKAGIPSHEAANMLANILCNA